MVDFPVPGRPYIAIDFSLYLYDNHSSMNDFLLNELIISSLTLLLIECCSIDNKPLTITGTG